MCLISGVTGSLDSVMLSLIILVGLKFYALRFDRTSHVFVDCL